MALETSATQSKSTLLERVNQKMKETEVDRAQQFGNTFREKQARLQTWRGRAEKLFEGTPGAESLASKVWNFGEADVHNLVQKGAVLGAKFGKKGLVMGAELTGKGIVKGAELTGRGLRAGGVWASNYAEKKAQWWKEGADTRAAVASIGASIGKRAVAGVAMEAGTKLHEAKKSISETKQGILSRWKSLLGFGSSMITAAEQQGKSAIESVRSQKEQIRLRYLRQKELEQSQKDAKERERFMAIRKGIEEKLALEEWLFVESAIPSRDTDQDSELAEFGEADQHSLGMGGIHL